MSPDKQPRIACICPTCKKEFPLSATVFRQRSKNGMVIPSCSRKCARSHWQQVKEYAKLTRGINARQYP